MNNKNNKRFSLLRTSRKFHKWLMLFIGVQFVIWSVTGFYMVFVDIDYIHGDSLVVNHQTKVDSQMIKVTLGELLQQYPDAKDISIGTFINNVVYRFTVPTPNGSDKILLDANSGAQLSPLNKELASQVAQHHYAGAGAITEIELISENPPFELSPRALPAWRVNFAAFDSPALYVSAQSGELVAKRHQFWRLFDWMFRFHVMDYGDSEDVENLLLFWFSLFGLVATVSGLILTYFRVFKSGKSAKRLSNLATGEPN